MSVRQDLIGMRSIIGNSVWMRVCAFIICCATLSGCSSEDGPQLYTTTGHVTWQGVPLETGRIVFVQKGSDSRSFSSTIENGDFKIETQGGPMRVEIRASRPVAGKTNDDNPPPPGQAATEEVAGEMFIPAKYNSQSELEVKVPVEGDSPVFQLTE